MVSFHHSLQGVVRTQTDAHYGAQRGLALERAENEMLVLGARNGDACRSDH